MPFPNPRILMAESCSFLAAALRPDADLEELLRLAGGKYALEFEPVSLGGASLQILQIADMRERLDRAIAEKALHDALGRLPLWAKIWPASLVLGHVLSRMPARGRSLLEIGAGCGVAGLAAAALGFESVCITDIDADALLFARINILKNNLQDRAYVCRADLRSDTLADMPEGGFDLIVGSEILYLEDLYRPLVKFIKRHLAAPGADRTPEALLTTDHRRSAKGFFKRAEKEFHIEHRQIGVRENLAQAQDDREARPERHLLTVHRLTPLR